MLLRKWIPIDSLNFQQLFLLSLLSQTLPNLGGEGVGCGALYRILMFDLLIWHVWCSKASIVLYSFLFILSLYGLSYTVCRYFYDFEHYLVKNYEGSTFNKGSR